ncbi:D-tyrosyl-tRNA(Tyr) deacylase [Viridibacillus sp. YIM B01967]|uniref:D-aminoacyl-tRNA deacylase n=1 Tax=Viridibacillus soli TaxID=2798301 RepID=A0ABS1H1Y7_9BACL|nr:D-aminoacyl-tRNA deacylase [Viridibacillus soli]MBK3493406.1 D-tyrosyl-tRNA(Tyr) deacylase [Viridibacillus soli]
MKVVLQRSRKASVTVDGQITGAIEQGYVLLVGITNGDTQADADYLANKIAKMRLWEDADGKMNHSIMDHGGAILSVSQFTLYADTRKGNRPSFIEAARPEEAKPMWDYFNETLRNLGLSVETGVFGAMMDVQLMNAGPVTIIIESK